LRAARFEEPVRGVLAFAALDDAVDGRGLGVTADFRGVRFFLTGDSPLTPRASKVSASGFPSEGTKMLVYGDERSRTEIQEQARERTRHDHETEF
jgi:hypothetical protein